MSSSSATAPSVLIVDDDVDICCNMRDILEELGFVADTATDGPSAIEAVQRHAYDIALLDYKMPGMDGATLYSKIRGISPKTVGIMITAFAGSDGAEQARNAGTWKVLRKPVAIQELIDLMQSALRRPLILVVDDDADFCDNMWQILRDRNYRVAIANTEPNALLVAGAEEWDLALVDLRLGDGDGRRVVKQLCQQHPAAEVIIVTAFCGDVDDLGSYPMLSKPIDVSQLMRLVENRLELS